MKNSITIFNQLLNIIPHGKFQQIVEEFNEDKYVKKFNSFHHFIVLLFAQLNENGSIIVFDKGYIDYKWLHSLHQKGVFFVTRAKDNMVYEVSGQQEFTEGTGVISDEIIILKGHKAAVDYPERLRMVKYYDIKTDKLYRDFKKCCYEPDMDCYDCVFTAFIHKVSNKICVINT